MDRVLITVLFVYELDICVLNVIICYVELHDIGVALCTVR